MAISADVIRSHIDYSAWASRRLVEAVSRLSPEELNRDFHTADRTVLGTLVHTFAADRLWLYRLAGGQNPGFISDSDHSLEVLQNDWPALHDRWRAWARNLTDDQVAAKLAYRDMSGNPWEQPVWQLVLHVVNHATHHRGQVTGFLRSLGHAPPQLDLVLYYRTMPDKSAAGGRD